MIREHEVLFRIQDLQQGRRGIAPKSAPSLSSSSSMKTGLLELACLSPGGSARQAPT